MTRPFRSLLRGVVLVVLFIPVPRAFAQLSPRVLVMELSAEPPVGSPEFVELLVGGQSPLAPDRIAIRDSRPIWRGLPSDYRPLLPGTRVVLTPDSAAFNRLHGRVPTGSRLFEVRPWPALNNSGDSLLVSVDGVPTDRAAYHGDRIQGGFTSERISPAVPARAGFNWKSSQRAGGTPGAQNSVHQEDLDPPIVIGAERLDTGVLWLWMNEPILNDGLNEFSLFGESVPAHVNESGPFGSTRVEIPAPIASMAPRILVGGIKDPTGNTMTEQTVEVAIPAGLRDLLITEVMVRGVTDWVEITGIGTQTVSLRDVQLSAPSWQEPLAPVDSTRHLLPHASIVVPATVSAAGTSLVLVAKSTQDTLDTVRIGPDLEDPRFSDHRDRSLVRVGAGEHEWASSLVPASSPGSDTFISARAQRTVSPPPLSVVLTEVLYEPRTDPDDGIPDQSEFLEWTLGPGASVDLYGAFLTYGVDERGMTDTLRVGYQPIVMNPGDSVILLNIPSHVDDTPGAAGEFLQAAWPETPEEGILIPTRRPLSLRNNGRRIALHARDGTVLSDDTYTPSMHLASLRETRGLSLARRQVGAGWSPLQSAVQPTPGWTLSAFPADEDAVVPDDERPVAWLAPISIYPNHPEWGASTDVAYLSDGPARLSIAVYDLAGRPVRHLARDVVADGSGSIPWDGRTDRGETVPAGLYMVFVHISGSATSTFRLPVAVLVR